MPALYAKQFYEADCVVFDSGIRHELEAMPLVEMTGGTVRTDLDGLIIVRFKTKGDVSLVLAIDKRSAAHIASLVKEGRRFWKPFKLPKMKEQYAGAER